MAWKNTIGWTGAVLSLAGAGIAGLSGYFSLQAASDPHPGDIGREVNPNNEGMPVQPPRHPPLNPDRPALQDEGQIGIAVQADPGPDDEVLNILQHPPNQPVPEQPPRPPPPNPDHPRPDDERVVNERLIDEVEERREWEDRRNDMNRSV